MIVYHTCITLCNLCQMIGSFVMAVHYKSSCMHNFITLLKSSTIKFYWRTRHILKRSSCICIAGHEYSLTNLKFAASLQPDNERVREKLEEVIDRRSTKHCTV